MNPAPRAGRRASIEGPAGPLEAIVTDPASAPTAWAVVCHPHPLHGGTMDNKVVTTLARALQECAIATVRFNFRGVGASAGAYDEGRGETDDAAAVAAWAERCRPGLPLLAAGFSFGAYVALLLAQRRPLGRLIMIAPPVRRFDFSGISPPACPSLIVQGDADEVVDANEVRQWAGASLPPPRLIMLAGVGHFFHGHLHELRDTVVREIRSG